ncbi:helix-turn-helix domain-containing protein [Companilactobacillus baiquanensis]|uniref:LysR family transcriptional regulator n=1 Tax=Companilactobacillus baiquanensis TaxID=2486005 RepID=A0ABW1UZ73_9LACO|nr:LysR family transcriptional regulator [Companilactobacillus baiquanensis]
MNIYRLEIFIDLVKTLNYTNTAENFFTTQSNISKQILSLEK